VTGTANPQTVDDVHAPLDCPRSFSPLYPVAAGERITRLPIRSLVDFAVNGRRYGMTSVVGSE